MLGHFFPDRLGKTILPVNHTTLLHGRATCGGREHFWVCSKILLIFHFTTAERYPRHPRRSTHFITTEPETARLTTGPTWTSCQVSPPCVCPSWPPPGRTPRPPPGGSAASGTCSPGPRCKCPGASSATLEGRGRDGGTD